MRSALLRSVTGAIIAALAMASFMIYQVGYPDVIDVFRSQLSRDWPYFTLLVLGGAFVGWLSFRLGVSAIAVIVGLVPTPFFQVLIWFIYPFVGLRDNNVFNVVAPVIGTLLASVPVVLAWFVGRNNANR